MSGRGNRTLEQYDKTDDVSPQARQDRKFRDRPPAPYIAVLYGPGCWCGAESGHDWPGKADGAPHPRDWPGRVNGHGFRS